MDFDLGPLREPNRTVQGTTAANVQKLADYIEPYMGTDMCIKNDCLVPATNAYGHLASTRVGLFVTSSEPYEWEVGKHFAANKAQVIHRQLAPKCSPHPDDMLSLRDTATEFYDHIRSKLQR